MLAVDTSGVGAYVKWLEEEAVALRVKVQTAFLTWGLNIHADIVELTPQWSGNLASNWAFDVGSKAYTATYYTGPARNQPIQDGTRGDPLYSRGMEPAVSISLARARQAPIPQLSDTIYIHNPVAYADDIENDTSDPRVRAINRVPRSETGKIAMVTHAWAKYSQQKATVF